MDHQITDITPIEGTSSPAELKFANDCFECFLPDQTIFHREALQLLHDWSVTQPDRRIGAQYLTYFPLEYSWHSHDKLHLVDPFRWLKDHVEKIVADQFQVSMQVFSMWAIISRKKSRGDRHDHRGRISGVYYLDNGHSPDEPITAQINFHTSNGIKRVAPKNGQLLLFSAKLEHDVEMYLGTGRRAVVAFNLE